MPSRGPYWKEGGIPDFTIQESDLVQELQDKVNEGGHVIEDEGTPLAQQSNLNFTGAGVTATDSGGKTLVTIPGGGGGSGGSGFTYATIVWGSGPTQVNTGSISPLGGVGYILGETGDSGVEGVLGRAGKINQVTINVKGHGVGTTTVNFKKNGTTTVKTYSFGNADVGTIVTDTTDVTFTATDKVWFEVTSVSGARWNMIIEYDLDGVGGGGSGFDKRSIGDFSEWYVYDEMVHPTRAGVLVHWENRGSATDTFTVPVARGGVVTYGTGTTSGVNGTNITTCAGGGAGIAIGGDYLYRTRIKLNTINDLLFWAGGMDSQFPEINDRTTVVAAELTAVINGIFFRYEGGTDTNFQCVTESADTQTIVDSGVVVDTAYHEFEIDCDGVNAIFKIDGVQVANITTNIPTGINLITGNQINSLATGPSNNRTYDIDMMFIFSTTRT